MTSEELEKLDVEVAEKVFGMTWQGGNPIDGYDGKGWPPPYSTDMNYAWKVAEKLKMTVTPKTDRTPRSAWLADVELKGNGQVWRGYGPTAAIAICRAALSVVI